jgi:hypothetical protein
MPSLISKRSTIKLDNNYQQESNDSVESLCSDDSNSDKEIKLRKKKSTLGKAKIPLVPGLTGVSFVDDYY